jgi:PAS domain S-box-containing protein
MLCIALASTYGLRSRIVLLANEGGALAQASLQILAGVHHSLAGLRGWVSSGDGRYLEEWQAAWKNEIKPALALLQGCQHSLDKVCEQERLQELTGLLNALYATQRKIQALARTPDNEPARVTFNSMEKETGPLAERAITLARALASDAQALLTREANSARAASAVAVWLLAALIIGMLGVAYAMSRQRAEDLARPIASLAEATRQLASGRLNHDIPVDDNDSYEIGALTHAFNAMRTTLQHAQAALRDANALLEQRVSERTAELAATNDSLTQEIAVRTRTEDALRESEARLRAIVDALPDPVFVLDNEGRYIEVLTSRHNQFNPGPTALKGKCLHETYEPALAESLLQIIQRALATRQIEITEYELPGTRGRRWFESRTAPIEVPFTTHPAAIVVSRDITQRKIDEAQLRQAQKMEALGQLTGGIAHDFNNLLAVILGNLEWVDEQLNDDSSLRPLVRRALDAVERGAKLTRRLLTFSRRQPLEAQPTDLNQLILGMIDLMRRTLGDTILIHTVLAADLALALIDPAQLENALLNLALNARDAMPEGGTLTLKTENTCHESEELAMQTQERSTPYVMLAVSDTGVGMSADVLERAFEPLFTTKPHGKGSGFGLSMVYGLVSQAGGNIAIDSEVNQGTTIKLYLPPATVVAEFGENTLGDKAAYQKDQRTI